MVTGKIRWDWTFELTDTDNWEQLFKNATYADIYKMKEALKNFKAPTEYKREQYEIFKLKHPELFE